MDYYCCYLTITVLNDVAQGTTAITRLKRKILMKSVLVQGTLTNSSGQGRILIVYDRQANGAAPAATDVLTSNTIMAIQNLDNRDRFIILADIFPYAQDETLAAGNNGSGLRGIMAYKRYIKCNLETIYGGNAGTIADINSGSFDADQLQWWNCCRRVWNCSSSLCRRVVAIKLFFSLQARRAEGPTSLLKPAIF